MNASLPSVSGPADRIQLPPRLGFAVMVGEDGNLPEELLIGLSKLGYTGIEPNCYQVQHLPPIIAACQSIGLAIHAIPTGRWMNSVGATVDYQGYTRTAYLSLQEGAAIAASVGAALILGLIRGPSSIAAGDAEEFLVSVIQRLLHTTPELQILVEPIAVAETCWPHTVAQGTQLINKLKQPRVKLLADSYHIVRSGEDPNIDQYHSTIGHLHIRDEHKQVPTYDTPEYAAIIRLWHNHNVVLSFEPDINIRDTLEQATAGVHWIKQQLMDSPTR